MRAAGRAGKGTALTHDTANNNEEEKPWADKRHFSIIISFYMEWWLHYLSNAIRQLSLTDFFIVLLCLPSLVSFSPCLYGTK
jgi:hypothetical protein